MDVPFFSAWKPREFILRRAGPSSSTEPSGYDVPTRNLCLRKDSPATLSTRGGSPLSPIDAPLGLESLCCCPLLVLSPGACHPDPAGRKSHLAADGFLLRCTVRGLESYGEVWLVQFSRGVRADAFVWNEAFVDLSKVGGRACLRRDPRQSPLFYEQELKCGYQQSFLPVRLHGSWGGIDPACLGSFLWSSILPSFPLRKPLPYTWILISTFPSVAGISVPPSSYRLSVSRKYLTQVNIEGRTISSSSLMGFLIG